jgi:hypothetical protein
MDQKRFDDLLEAASALSNELAVEAALAYKEKDDDKGTLLANACDAVSAAISLIDPYCNPKFVVTVTEV